MKLNHLIPKIQEGDQRAFRELYEHYAPLFKGIAYRYVGDASEANDLIQESFIKIFRNTSSYKNEGSFEGWMKRILVNNCLNYIKKEKKHQFDSEDRLLDLPSHDWDPIIDELSFEELVAVIDQLPIGYKTVFNLCVFEGYSHKEVAETLKITESASRSQLTKAKLKLRGELKKINIFSSIA